MSLSEEGTKYLVFGARACMLRCFTRARLCATLWTVACQAPLSMGFSRQEYWSGLPCPPPGDLPNPGIEPASLMSPALAGRFLSTSVTWEVLFDIPWGLKVIVIVFVTYQKEKRLGDLNTVPMWVLWTLLSLGSSTHFPVNHRTEHWV